MIHFITLCIKSLQYHSNLNKLTNDYVQVLAKISNDSRTTENTWFLIYRLINESPLRQSLFNKET